MITVSKNVIIAAILSITFVQCSSSPLENVSPGEQAFILSWQGLRDFQGVLWLFRDKYKINPSSYKEMVTFIDKFKLNYDNPFERLEFIASGDDENDIAKIHYLLKAEDLQGDVFPDYQSVEIEADVIVKFVSWESSIAMIQGKNVKCLIDNNGSQTRYQVDSTNYYLTMVPEETINKLKGNK
jgi:hypothetical protein